MKLHESFCNSLYLIQLLAFSYCLDSRLRVYILISVSENGIRFS